MNRTLWIGSKTFCIGFGFPRDFLPWETSASESCDTQLDCDTLFTIATAFLSSLSLLFWDVALFSAFHLVVHQPRNAETDTCLQPYNPFHFYRIGTRADANIHNSFACKFPSNNICTVVEGWTHGYLCLGYFSSSTHFNLAGLFLTTGNRYFFLLQRWTITLDSLSLLLTQFSHAWRESFVIEVSDLYFSSPSFSTFDSWEPITSDESPCRTTLIRLWVDQTHVSSICTDFPRSHRMEFLTSTAELRPILYRSPECCHHEE